MKQFNRIDVDGCMSTNDTVLLLISGASGTEPDLTKLNGARQAVTALLARRITGDGKAKPRLSAASVGVTVP